MCGKGVYSKNANVSLGTGYSKKKNWSVCFCVCLKNWISKLSTPKVVGFYEAGLILDIENISIPARTNAITHQQSIQIRGVSTSSEYKHATHSRSERK